MKRYMQATDILESEHEQILKVITLLERAADKLEKGENVPPEVFEKAAFFIREYADRIHHLKEEDFLFGVLQHRHLSKEVAISIMLTEHDQGRFYLRKMLKENSAYKQGAQDTRPGIIENARKYAALLREHIDKEYKELFPISNEIMPEKNKQELLRIFLEKDKRENSKRYLKLIAEIEEMLKPQLAILP